MENQLVYRFPSSQVANRFLNSLKHWSVAPVEARLWHGSDTVKVSYQYNNQGFDRTSAELDDLAASYEGSEVS